MNLTQKFSLSNLHIGTLGGHSALDIGLGARKQGLKTVVVCEKGREKTYTDQYRHLFDQVIVVDKFRELTSSKVISKLKKLHTIFIQSRYFWVYCDYDQIEKNFPIPIFGTRGLVCREERDVKKNQYYMMRQAGIRHPKIYIDPKKIDRLVLVKVAEAERKHERAFFIAKNYGDYQKQVRLMLKAGTIDKNGLSKSVIEEFVLGASFNFNFFYSPLKKRVELLGIDTRRASNISGLTSLPASDQLEILKHIKPQYVEAGHTACTVKESVLEKAFDLAERLVKVLKDEFSPGMIGPFALQTMLVPGPPKEELVTFDLSLRMPGSPGSVYTPYSEYLFERPVSVGERVAMEIKQAVKAGKLNQVTT